MAYDKCAPIMRRSSWLLLAAVLLSGCSSGGGNGGPTATAPWPRFRHDGANTGTGGGEVATVRGTPLSIAVDDIAALSPVVSSPALAIDGSVYIASQGGTLKALNADGSKKWAATTCGACPAGDQVLGEFQSSPTVYTLNNQTQIFIGSNSGRVYGFTEAGGLASCNACFDPQLADPDIRNAQFVSSAGLITHTATGNVLNVLITASFERASRAGTFGKLYSLSPTGALHWEYPSGVGWPAAFTASPAIGPGLTVLVAGDDGSIHALSPSGILQWSSRFTNLRDSEAAFAQTPVLSSGAIYFNAAEGEVVALTVDGQTELWRKDTGSPFASSMVLSVQPLVELSPTPTALPVTPTPTPPPATATAANDTPVATPVRSATAIASPTPTTALINSTLFAMSKAGELIIIDVRTGELVPTSELQEAITGEVFSSPAYSLDGYLVFGDSSGKLYALNGTTGISAWSPIQLTAGSAIRSSPAIGADGTIWIGADDGHLYRIGAK